MGEGAYDRLHAALVKALPNLKHLTVLIPHSDISDLPRVNELRKNFITPLRQAGGDKVRIFVKSPFGADVAHSYVHAKTWIFDDQFAIIGSANVNRRSWTHDSEIDVGVYDESTNSRSSYTFAHRLRISLWAEHLNMNTADGHVQLADGVAGSIHWFLPGTTVALFDETIGRDTGPLSASPLSVVDPDGT
jgi:phosphatidylserine/phosphatidylglycerophosphate/cardiolipin synthase-like enzyme